MTNAVPCWHLPWLTDAGNITFLQLWEEPRASTGAAEGLCNFFVPTKDLSYKYFSVLLRYLHATGLKKAELQCLLVLGCRTMPAASTDRA